MRMRNIAKWMKVRALPRLNLELSNAGAIRKRLGMLVLIVGVVFVATVMTRYLYAIRQMSVLEASMALPVVQESDQPANSKEVEAAQEAITHLALPWGSLFTALETTVSDKISIISIEPDVNKSTVKIVAEAMDVFQMLEYFRALQQQPILRDVLLTGYEVKVDAADQPVRFTLTALWVQTP